MKKTRDQQKAVSGGSKIQPKQNDCNRPVMKIQKQTGKRERAISCLTKQSTQIFDPKIFFKHEQTIKQILIFGYPKTSTKER